MQLKEKNSLPTLVATLTLKGELYHRMSLFLEFFRFASIFRYPIFSYLLQFSDIRYKENIGYRKIEAKRKNSRKRNILWYNSPFSVNVATNVGKEFFQLIDKYFPPHHRLHKIINRNCVKMSYSCMPNIGDIINQHAQ